MDHKALTLYASEWCKEFETVSGNKVPEKLPAFVATRLIETGIVDADTVRVVFTDRVLRVKVTGQSGQMIHWKAADGPSVGMSRVRDFHQDDRERLAKALDDL